MNRGSHNQLVGSALLQPLLLHHCKLHWRNAQSAGCRLHGQLPLQKTSCIWPTLHLLLHPLMLHASHAIGRRIHTQLLLLQWLCIGRRVRATWSRLLLPHSCCGILTSVQLLLLLQPCCSIGIAPHCCNVSLLWACCLLCSSSASCQDQTRRLKVEPKCRWRLSQLQNYRPSM